MDEQLIESAVRPRSSKRGGPATAELAKLGVFPRGPACVRHVPWLLAASWRHRGDSID